MADTRYGMCSKCGAVSKNGKCSKCGRISFASDNSAMDELRAEKSKWNRQNAESHQDHCNDSNSGANVYLNGKIIRYGGKNVWAEENKRFQYQQDVFDNHQEEHSTQYEPIDYDEGYDEIEDNTVSAQRETYASTVNQIPVSQPAINTNPKTVVKRKKRGAIMTWVIVATIIIEMISCAEENKISSDNFGPLTDVINEISEIASTGNSDNSSNANNGFSQNAISYGDSDIYEYAFDTVYPEIIKNKDTLSNAYEIAQATNSFTDEDTNYYLTDYIDTSVGYSIMWNTCYYNNMDKEERPTDFEFSMYYPQIVDSDFKYEDKINRIIYDEGCKVFGDYKDYPDDAANYHLGSSGFVTYMDKYTLSLYFAESLSADENISDKTYGRCIVIDLQSGSVINAKDYFNVGDKFTEAYNSMVELYWGEEAEYISTEDILAAMDNGTFQWIRTPMGFVLGIYYDQYNICDLYNVLDIKPYIQ